MSDTSGNAVDERRLAERATRGDARAFADLVTRYQNAVYRLCLRYGAEEAQDLAQETFMRAFVHRERFDPTRPILPWLLTIARRLCIDRVRKHKPVLAEDDRPLDPADEHPDAEATLATREQLGQLKQAHSKLADGPREAIALYHWEGLSYDEIAKIMNVPMGTVMTWLHRGRAQLRKALEEAQVPVARGSAS
ncbi:MAG: RNA polymerase sigma factor [Myxococcota bacterium]